MVFSHKIYYSSPNREKFVIFDVTNIFFRLRMIFKCAMYELPARPWYLIEKFRIILNVTLIVNKMYLNLVIYCIVLEYVKCMLMLNVNNEL